MAIRARCRLFATGGLSHQRQGTPVSLLTLTAILLAAAVVAVPLSRRLGLGSVLGYLAAGLVLGPAGLGLIEDVESVLHFSELGVVLLLFVIGLELHPARLWTMRRPIIGIGGLQVVITAVAIGAVAAGLGQDLRTAIVVGLALALSSTAFALQLLSEKGHLVAHHGRTAFSILLFQDLAVIPVVALVPLLAIGETESAEPTEILLAVLRVIAIVATVIVAGHFALRHVLRLVARSGVREVFIASALLTVIGTALIVHGAGLSMALGAFLAGVLLADSEFRHALEADIEPFKGLLLGLFFMAVGMSVHVELMVIEWALVLALVAGLTALKCAVLYALGAFSGHGVRPSLILAVSLAQGGEFAFVIFTIAVGAGVVAPALADLLILVVALSMAVTPLLFFLAERLSPRTPGDGADRPFDVAVQEENRVIIAGFGRFGQIVGRVLRARRIPFTALEASSEQVDFVTRYGSKVYYGDASRLDLLRAAKADQATLFVLAIDDVEASMNTARMVVENFPHLRILARARNRRHAYRLMDLGIRDIWRETFLSGLDTAREVLTGLGLSASEADRTVEMFREHDEARLLDQHGRHTDDARMAAEARQWSKELEEIFEQDAADQASDETR